MTSLKKIGLLSRPEVSLPRIVSTQKAVFKAFFFRKSLFQESYTEVAVVTNPSKLQISECFPINANRPLRPLSLLPLLNITTT